MGNSPINSNTYVEFMLKGVLALRLGILGYGSIAKDLVHRLEEGQVSGVEPAVILRRSPSEAATKVPIVTSLDEFLTYQPELVIESTGQDGLREFGLRMLESGISLVVVSVGALADPSFRDALWKTAAENGAKVYFPSAAIAGLDRIAAAREGQLDQVRLVTRKPPKAWLGTEVESRLDLASLSEPVLVFQGMAPEAATRFPESVNVSAALGLAGVGMEKTEVEVWVDPHIAANHHQVFAQGDFGSLTLEVSNRPSENPKTGVIVAMSLIKLLRNLVSPFVVGI